MRIYLSVLAAYCCLLCGCAHDKFRVGRGDVGQFIVQQAFARCGRTVSTNGLPAISGHWSYFADEDEVVVRMPREQYPAIESFLRQAFGDPKLGPVDTKDGGKIGVYRLTAKGGGLFFGYDAGRTEVIVIRPMSIPEVFKGFHKAAQDERFWKNWSQ